MDSSYFGEPSMGSGRSGSSRRGKKSNSDKPKQPQRGLGVAQLEKIRLHNQLGSSYLPSLHSPYTNFNQQEEDVRSMQTTYSSVPSSSAPSYSSSSTPSSGLHSNIMMGLGEMETTDIRYGDSQSSTARWSHSNGLLDPQHSAQPTVTRHFFDLQVQDSLQKNRRELRNSVDSSGQNSQSSETQELDLELKLSL